MRPRSWPRRVPVEHVQDVVSNRAREAVDTLTGLQGLNHVTSCHFRNARECHIMHVELNRYKWSSLDLHNRPANEGLVSLPSK